MYIVKQPPDICNEYICMHVFYIYMCAHIYTHIDGSCFSMYSLGISTNRYFLEFSIWKNNACSCYLLPSFHSIKHFFMYTKTFTALPANFIQDFRQSFHSAKSFFILPNVFSPHSPFTQSLRENKRIGKVKLRAIQWGK